MSLLEKVFGKKPGQREFATLVSKAFADHGVEVASFDDKTFSFKLANGTTIFLDNVHNDFERAVKQDRKNVIQRFVAGTSVLDSIPEDFTIARPSIIPVIRSDFYFFFTDLKDRADGTERPDSWHDGAHEKLARDLILLIGFDTEIATQIVGQSDFEKWGLSFAEVLPTALDNLREYTDPDKLVEVDDGLFEGKWDDSYDSSRMLLTDLMHRLPLRGDPVVFVPKRDKLFVTGSRDTDGLRAMIQRGEPSHFETYALSPYLYRLEDGRWARFFPEDAGLCNSLASIERRRLALDYGLQKEYLESLNEREKTDIFVATFQVWEDNATKRQSSICVWSNGIDSLLPQAEQVLLLINAETKERVKVSWDIAREIVGHLMEERTDLVPVRFRVRAFPSEQEIAKLREAVAKLPND